MQELPAGVQHFPMIPQRQSALCGQDRAAFVLDQTRSQIFSFPTSPFWKISDDLNACCHVQRATGALSRPCG